MNDQQQSRADALTTTKLPDGSGFAVASLPLPQDHWLYASRCAEWDSERDTSADTPHPILTHAQRDAVVAAVRYAIRSATMCGQDMDFDPDALVLNAVYALCGPFSSLLEDNAASPVEQPAPRADALTEAERLLLARVNDCTKPIDAADLNGILKLIDRLAACPVEQPAPAPTDKRCVGWAILNGVCVVDFSRDRAEADRTACEMQRSHDLSGSLASFHVEPVFIRTDAAPAPAPADERAPLTMALNPNAPPLTMTLGPAQAAEPVAIHQVRAKGSLKWQDIEPIFLSIFADEERYVQRVVYAAPQPPALADAREGLTDEQIIREFYIHTVMDDEPLFTFDRPSALALARALLQGANND